MTQLAEEQLTRFLIDPVMSAQVLLGWELDHYQAAALRLDWWFPETIDDSGVSTGKTLRIFVLACLRAMLIPNQRIGIYFPNFTVGSDEFWPYFAQTIAQSDFFASQLAVHHGKLGEAKADGAWSMTFKNRSQIIMPRPGHAKDGSNQAGRRFNTLIVDDWRRCEEMGDAIAKQLLDRVTRPSFNPKHPIWENHVHFKGHAEGPGHKSHARVKRFKRQITDGNTRYAVYSFCYRDVGFSGYSSRGRARHEARDSRGQKWTRILRPDERIKSQRVNLPPDRFQCQWLGIGVLSGKGFYSEAVLDRCRAPWVEILIRRATPEWNYFLGFDVAPGQSDRADYSCPFIWGAREADGRRIQPTLTSDDFGAWQIAAVHAHTLKNLSAGETAASMHHLHEAFGFKAITLDRGGGGQWVYPELKKAKQTWKEIGWMDHPVTPLCSHDEPLFADKQPIVRFFLRRDFDTLSFLTKGCKASDDGFVFSMHQRYQQAWLGREVAYPISFEDRALETTARWSGDQIQILKTLDKGFKELSRVKQQTNGPDGPAKLSANGFPKFIAVGKKDIAYAGFYGFIGLLRWLEAHGSEKEEDVSAVFSCD